MADEITMLQRVGAAILLAETQWNPKTAKESKERAMARAALAEVSDALMNLPRYAEESLDAGMGRDDFGDWLRRDDVEGALTSPTSSPNS